MSPRGARPRWKEVMKEVSSKFIKNLWSKESKRNSAKSIGMKFNREIIPESRSYVKERSVSYLTTIRIRRTSKSDN
jgi:hypothetical protein